MPPPPPLRNHNSLIFQLTFLRNEFIFKLRNSESPSYGRNGKNKRFLFKWPGFFLKWPGFLLKLPGFFLKWPGFLLNWPGFFLKWPCFFFKWPGFFLKWPGFFFEWLVTFLNDPVSFWNDPVYFLCVWFFSSSNIRFLFIITRFLLTMTQFHFFIFFYFDSVTFKCLFLHFKIKFKYSWETLF